MIFKVRKGNRAVEMAIYEEDLEYGREDVFARVCRELFFRMEGYDGALD